MKVEMTHFWRQRLFVNMPITKEDKFLIKIFCASPRHLSH